MLCVDPLAFAPSHLARKHTGRSSCTHYSSTLAPSRSLLGYITGISAPTAVTATASGDLLISSSEEGPQDVIVKRWRPASLPPAGAAAGEVVAEYRVGGFGGQASGVAVRFPQNTPSPGAPARRTAAGCCAGCTARFPSTVAWSSRKRSNLSYEFRFFLVFPLHHPRPGLVSRASLLFASQESPDGSAVFALSQASGALLQFDSASGAFVGAVRCRPAPRLPAGPHQQRSAHHSFLPPLIKDCSPATRFTPACCLRSSSRASSALRL